MPGHWQKTFSPPESAVSSRPALGSPWQSKARRQGSTRPAPLQPHHASEVLFYFGSSYTLTRLLVGMSKALGLLLAMQGNLHPTSRGPPSPPLGEIQPCQELAFSTESPAERPGLRHIQPNLPHVPVVGHDPESSYLMAFCRTSFVPDSSYGPLNLISSPPRPPPRFIILNFPHSWS